MKKIFLLVIVLFSFFAVAQPQKTKKDSLFNSIGSLVMARFELEIRSAQYEFLNELKIVTADGVLSRSNLFEVEAKKKAVEDIKEEANKALNFYGLKLRDNYNLGWTEEDADVWNAIDSLNSSVNIFAPYFPKSAIKHLQKALVIKCHRPITVSFYAHLFSFFLCGICLMVLAFFFYLADIKILFLPFLVVGCVALLLVFLNFLFSL